MKYCLIIRSHPHTFKLAKFLVGGPEGDQLREKQLRQQPKDRLQRLRRLLQLLLQKLPRLLQQLPRQQLPQHQLQRDQIQKLLQKNIKHPGYDSNAND